MTAATATTTATTTRATRDARRATTALSSRARAMRRGGAGDALGARARANAGTRGRGARRGDGAARACGIIGVVTRDEGKGVAAEIYEGLLMLQHRGQDSAGMVTYDGTRFKEKKDNGLVKDVFDKSAMKYLDGHIGMGHVRYPTAGGSERDRGATVLRESTAGDLFDS